MEDFDKARINGIDLLRRGSSYLVRKQDQGTQDTIGGWDYGTDQPDVNPTITAYAIWALINSLRYNRSARIEESIDRGIKYIVRHWKNVKVERSEYVREPTHNGEFEKHKFDLPYYLVLSAALYSGQMGYKDKRVIDILKDVTNAFPNMLRKHKEEPLEEGNALISWDLAKIAYSLTATYSLINVIENSFFLFASIEARENKQEYALDSYLRNQVKTVQRYMNITFAYFILIIVINLLYVIHPIKFFSNQNNQWLINLFSFIFTAAALIIAIVDFFINRRRNQYRNDLS